MRVSPTVDPRCYAFEEYKELPETVDIDFLEGEFIWKSLKFSNDSGEMGVEAIELNQWLLRLI